jgi:hypothetical protein
MTRHASPLWFASDPRFAYFGTAAFAVRPLRLDRGMVSGVPMTLRCMANVLSVDATLFQQFCDRPFEVWRQDDGVVRGRHAGRGAVVFLRRCQRKPARWGISSGFSSGLDAALGGGTAPEY